MTYIQYISKFFSQKDFTKGLTPPARGPQFSRCDCDKCRNCEKIEWRPPPEIKTERVSIQSLHEIENYLPETIQAEAECGNVT